MDVIPGMCGSLGAEIRGVELRSIDHKKARDIVAAVHEHHLLSFTDQKMTVQEYMELGRKLGTIIIYPDKRYHHPEHEEVFVSANVKSQKMGMARSGYFWHTDLSFKPTPQPLTVLFPQVLPQGRRETLFVNMADVYSRLPAHLRAVVDNRTAKHDPALRYKVEQADVDASLDLGEILEKGRRMFPAPDHPCVFEHPVNKKQILYMNEGFTTSINGLSYEESHAALSEIFAFTRRPEHVHTYTWKIGAVVIWDNRMLIHKSGATEGEAMIFRLCIDDMVPFYDGVAKG